MFRYASSRLTTRITGQNVRFASQKQVGASQMKPAISSKAAPAVQLSPDDPRPLWVYRLTIGLRYLLIPTALIYGVFFADFGEDDHVFVPPRRWVARQKAAFFPSTSIEQPSTEATVAETPSSTAEAA